MWRGAISETEPGARDGHTTHGASQTDAGLPRRYSALVDVAGHCLDVEAVAVEGHSAIGSGGHHNQAPTPAFIRKIEHGVAGEAVQSEVRHAPEIKLHGNAVPGLVPAHGLMVGKARKVHKQTDHRSVRTQLDTGDFHS